MNANWQDNEVLVDLLAKEAVSELRDDEQAALLTLNSEIPAAERAAMQAPVAALFCAAARREPIPSALREKILDDASSAFTSASVSPLVHPRNSTALSANVGWWAAAACFVLAVTGWWPRLTSKPETSPTAQISASEQREKMLAQQNAIRVSLTAASDQPLTGDVVFDPQTQSGFLRFRGIPANDPRFTQYQLWIADAGRKQPEPIDGGVFNVTGETTSEIAGEIIVPFKAKLAVDQAAAFVVTIEQPGGVVVSKQERVLALARLPVGT
jgi:hypothetical protein